MSSLKVIGLLFVFEKDKSIYVFFFNLKSCIPACLSFPVTVCVLVYILGGVKPAGKPLISWYNKENVGVLRRFMVKEHRLLWNGFLRTW